MRIFLSRCAGRCIYVVARLPVYAPWWRLPQALYCARARRSGGQALAGSAPAPVLALCGRTYVRRQRGGGAVVAGPPGGVLGAQEHPGRRGAMLAVYDVVDVGPPPSPPPAPALRPGAYVRKCWNYSVIF